MVDPDEGVNAEIEILRKHEKAIELSICAPPNDWSDC